MHCSVNSHEFSMLDNDLFIIKFNNEKQIIWKTLGNMTWSINHMNRLIILWFDHRYPWSNCKIIELGSLWIIKEIHSIKFMLIIFNNFIPVLAEIWPLDKSNDFLFVFKLTWPVQSKLKKEKSTFRSYLKNLSSFQRAKGQAFPSPCLFICLLDLCGLDAPRGKKKQWTSKTLKLKQC